MALKYPGATNVVIKTTDVVPVTLELDTDYIINNAGFPEILEGVRLTPLPKSKLATVTLLTPTSRR